MQLCRHWPSQIRSGLRQKHVLSVGHSHRKQRGPLCRATGPPDNNARSANAVIEGPSTDFSVIYTRLTKLCLPYWASSDVKGQARTKLAGVVVLTLGCTGVSVLFNFLGRDFFNALAEKNAEGFTTQILRYLGGFTIGIPVFVFRSYFQSRLSLEWREWMTKELMAEYFKDRRFYQLQLAGEVDNPDQRISADIRNFCETALSLLTTLLNAAIDLVSFSGILYTIYPPLFGVLLAYSIGGTAISIAIGKKLVTLNFLQEAREADFRYNLVRVRENAESIAFYGGEQSEVSALLQTLKGVVSNYFSLLVASRNLDFFTSFYRYLIQLVPAAVVAPLFFRGEIEFGVVNQSQSAFNHILTDVSLVVYQFENLAGFGAVVDRLGQFLEVVQSRKALPSAEDTARGDSGIVMEDIPWHFGPGANGSERRALLELQDLTVITPGSGNRLVQDLSIKVWQGESLLIMGASGAGKTSLLRAIAGLWSAGSGSIVRHGRPVRADGKGGDILFVPQRPYVVLGSLRDQLLYPLWLRAPQQQAEEGGAPAARALNGAPPRQLAALNAAANGAAVVNGNGVDSESTAPPPPTDQELEAALTRVQLGPLLQRCRKEAGGGSGLDVVADWASRLSLGEQQRLAFARVLLAKPRLCLMDESTSSLDQTNEAILYQALQQEGITTVSVGHRTSLLKFHQQLLLIQPNVSSTSAADEDADGSSFLARGPNWQLMPATAAPEVMASRSSFPATISMDT